MRPSKYITPLAASALFSSATLADRILETNSLEPCPGTTDGGFTATLFDVTVTPDNNTVTYDITAVVSISGKVNATIDIIAYGYSIKAIKLDPCSTPALTQLCPLSPGSFNLPSNLQLDPGTLNAVPGIAYSIPDVDAVVRATITNVTDGSMVACVQASLSNGKTVDQIAVKWVTAIIAGIALCTSAIMSGLGHSNTAAHVAANALSLFGFFQSQAIIGMTAVRFPPIAQSWVQNFAWSMGIIHIGFMQTVLTWYQRATGGAPSTLLSNLQTYSVSVNKRGLDLADKLMKRGMTMKSTIPSTVSGEIMKRGASLVARDDGSASTPSQSAVYGIERMGFRENIEPTNIFLTGLGIFVAFVVATAIFVALFKGICELAAKRNWIKGDQFLDFRNGWKVILKGILFRIVLIGYAQMTILCLWELTVRDSAAEVVTAIFYFVAMTLALAWAAVKVWRLAKRSVHMHKNPAYILYSDPAALNKWGFLYVQYRASAYYWIFPQLFYILIKAMFIAFGQGSGVAQAIGLLIIELAWLIGICITRPWMDKKTNSFNIAIASVSFVSAIILLIFSDVFNQPEIVTGVLGVLFALYNVIFAAVLLVMVLLASGYAIFSKNPDTRYQPMRDDRGSFIKSQTNLNTELDALGQTARGNNNMTMKRDLDEDTSSFAGSKEGYTGQIQPTNGSDRNLGVYGQHDAPASPGGQYGAHGGYAPQYGYDRSQTASPMNGGGYGRQQAPGSQWQRGAGYDH